MQTDDQVKLTKTEPIKHEKLRYQSNKLGFTLMLFGMVFLVFALFQVINVYVRKSGQAKPENIIPDIWLGVEILVSILLILLSFLCAEKLKTYSRNWLYVSGSIAVISFAKIFIFPLILVKELAKVNEAVGEAIHNPTLWLTITITSLVIAVAFYVAATVVSYIRTKQLESYYQEVGENE